MTHMNATRNRQRGVSLIELMVALTIGLVLIAGAGQIYVKSHATYETNDSVARLQETARYAMNVIESDVRMANFWGLSKDASDFVGKANQTGDPRATVAAGDPVNYCGTNFAADLSTNLQGDNNGNLPTSQGGGAGFLSKSRDAGNCGPLPNARLVTTADTLTIRRASSSPTISGTLIVCANPGKGGALLNNVINCPATSQQYDLLVNAYYVSRDSNQQTDLPALRRKQLTSGPVFSDNEVVAGVEDMQIQFGIDPTGATGFAAQYVEPDSVPAGAVIKTVRIWLLVRGETPEPGFVDDHEYEYGDRSKGNGDTYDLSSAGAATEAYKPSASPDDTATSVKHFRRLLVSRTIQVRNST
jgi:type IV pilus assembly protein PilW